MRLRVLILLIGIGSAAALAGGKAVVTPVALPNLPLGLVTFQKGKALNLSVSPGAGAFRAPADPDGRIWVVTDRGPVIDCSEEKDVIGAEDKTICATERRGKIYLLPGFAPAIYAMDLASDGTAKFTQMILLRGKSGRPLSGMTNPTGGARGEIGYGADGRVLDHDPSGIEPGGLVKLSDGTFWIAEEFGPSLLEVTGDGQVLRRLVPASVAEELRGADYPVEPTLPPIMGLRQVTRGFDGLAVSPNETSLYVAMQNALANPTVEAYRQSPATRIWKIDRASGKVTGEFVYRLDPPSSFPGEASAGPRPLRQSDVRISEIVAIGPDRLLVLERLRNASRLYRVDLDPLRQLPSAYGEDKMRPSLEELFPEVYEIAGISTLEKTLVFDSDQVKGMGGRLSAMAVLSPRELVLVSNNVYGVDAGKAQMFRLTFPSPILQ